MSEKRDYYEVLGCARDAAQTDIRKAYRKAASKAHPDKPGGSKEAMQEVDEAYKCLSDPDARRAYDSGAGEEQKLKAQAEALVEMMFEGLMEEFLNPLHDIVDDLRKRGAQALRTIDGKVDLAKRKQRRWERWAGRIRTRNGQANPTIEILVARVEEARAEIQECAREREVTLRAIAMLDNFEDTGPRETEVSSSAPRGPAQIESTLRRYLGAGDAA